MHDQDKNQSAVEQSDPRVSNGADEARGGVKGQIRHAEPKQQEYGEHVSPMRCQPHPGGAISAHERYQNSHSEIICAARKQSVRSVRFVSVGDQNPSANQRQHNRR
jgi:hypothetical protein